MPRLILRTCCGKLEYCFQNANRCNRCDVLFELELSVRVKNKYFFWIKKL